MSISDFEPSRITRAEFARRMDLTKGAITRAVEQGRVTLGPDKRIAWPDGKEEYEKKTRASTNSGSDSDRLLLNEVRARKFDAEAELKLLQLRERRGELVPVDLVRSRVSTAFGSLRDRFLAIPHRLSIDLARLTDPSDCRILLDREIRSALNAFASEYQDREEKEQEENGRTEDDDDGKRRYE